MKWILVYILMFILFLPGNPEKDSTNVDINVYPLKNTITVNKRIHELNANDIEPDKFYIIPLLNLKHTNDSIHNKPNNNVDDSLKETINTSLTTLPENLIDSINK